MRRRELPSPRYRPVRPRRSRRPAAAALSVAETPAKSYNPGDTTSTAPRTDFRVVNATGLPGPVLMWTTGGDLVLVGRDNSATEVLEGKPDDSVREASLSADGATVYLSLASPETCGDLARRDLPSGTIERLGLEGADPLPSPDGRRLAFVRGSPHWKTCGTELVIRELSTGHEQVWRSSGERLWAAGPVAWSPDGDRLLFGMSWESQALAGVIDTTAAGGVFAPAEELQPQREHFEWRPETFLADGRIALVGHCCWFYIPDHRDPEAVDRGPYLLTAKPGERPVESGRDLPEEWTRLHPDGAHYLWVDDAGVVWLHTAATEPSRVAEGALWASW